MVVKILETAPRSVGSSSSPAPSPTRARASSQPAPHHLPLPVALIYAYPALSFHFTSWLPSEDLKVLRSESHPDVASILRGKDHFDHRAPLSVVEDVEKRSSGSERGRPKVLRRKRTTSWGRGLVRGLPGSVSFSALRSAADDIESAVTAGVSNEDADEEQEEVAVTDDTEKSLSERVLWWDSGDVELQKELKEKVVQEAEKLREEIEGKKGRGLVGETRLAMTSRTAFFNGALDSPAICLLAHTDSSPAQIASSRRRWSVRLFFLLHAIKTAHIHLPAVSRDGSPLHRSSQRSRPSLGLPHLAHFHSA